MKNRKFVLVGLVSLMALVGCSSPEVTNGVTEGTNTAAAQSEEDAKAAEEAKAAELARIAQEEEEAAKAAEEAAKLEAEALLRKEQEAVQGMIALGELIGQKQSAVQELLGEAIDTTKLEETEILLAEYFKETVYDQTVTIEVVYNDEPGVVNFISMTCMQTDDVEKFVNGMADELTEAFGESSIERITSVRGTRRREWKDDKLTYVLYHIDDHITFDIYESDK